MSQALEVGQKLVSLCKEGKFVDAVDQLYSDDIVSIEARGSEEMPARLEGIQAIRGKNEWWGANHEIHSMDTTGPFVGHRDDQFAVKFDMDVTQKQSGQRMQMSEVALYTVRDGKVAEEEFLYMMA